MARIEPRLNTVPGVRAGIGVIAIVLCGLVAANTARAEAPPGAPGCPAPLATSHSSTAPTPVPTGPAVVTSSIEVVDAGAHLTDVDLFTDLDHSFAADLDVTLQSPAGTVVTITTDNGAGNDNVFKGTTFDDQADPDGQVPHAANPGLVTDHPYANLVAATPLVPEESLAAFNGEDPNGTWTITISDDLADDGGTLHNWRLDVTTGSCSAPPEDPAAPAQPDSPAAQPVVSAPPTPTPSDAKTAPSGTTTTTEPAALRLSARRLSVFGRPSARCRMTAGPVGSCRVEVKAGGRVIARGTRTGAKAAGRVRVPLKLTAAGHRVLSSRLGGIRASVSATAGTTSAKARTRAILAVERITTPAGSWVPNKAVLTPTGKQFVQSLRGRLIAVSSYRCDGHTAALEAARADSARARTLSQSRARVMCRALRQIGAKGKPGLVAHGGTEPIAPNGTPSGRAINRRVAITVSH
jgi:subtilisin-like proprotein convertase family protein/outer membrane protein OmpA-like peptidoglycan-associated protein